MQVLEREPAMPAQESTVVENELLSGGLDYYKLTMSQLHFEQHPDAEVTFTFKNRGQQRLADYVAPEDLQARLDWRRAKGWSEDELNYFSSLKNNQGEPMFSSDFLGYLRENGLPAVEVSLDTEKDDLAVTTTGPAALSTFWETVVMSDINEIYFEHFIAAHGLDMKEVLDEGERRLSDKIATLQANPSIKFADFGTRRHFSLAWQKHVIERLKQECPGNFVGTSNVALAMTEDLKPIGTFAHELPMVYAGIAQALGHDVRASHGQMLDDWYETYGVELSTALTDTFGSEFFFADFGKTKAEAWKSVRHDSGDPVVFGEHFIEFLKENGIDPTTKNICFSDGLTIDEIVKLQQHFEGRVGINFGWGTTLTNDLGPKALNIVMKATHVKLPGGQEADLVKLSDNAGKHTGPAELIEQYQEIFA